MRSQVPVSLCLLAVASLAGACAHNPPPPCTQPEPIQVLLKAGELMNPDDSGQSFPTIVRVYLLKSGTILETAAAEEVQRGDRELLGSELLEMQEVTVRPGKYERIFFKRNEDARVVAVVGLFRTPVGNSWRLIQNLPPADPDHCHKSVQPSGPRIGVVLDGSRIKLNR